MILWLKGDYPKKSQTKGPFHVGASWECRETQYRTTRSSEKALRGKRSINTSRCVIPMDSAQYSGCRASRSPAQVACNGNCCSFHQQVSRWVIRMWVPDGYNQAIPLSVEKFVLSGKHGYHKYFFYPHFLGTKPAPGSVCRVKPQRRAGQLCHSALLPAKIHFIFQNPALASQALGKHRCFNPLPHVVEQEPQGLQPSHCCAS